MSIVLFSQFSILAPHAHCHRRLPSESHFLFSRSPVSAPLPEPFSRFNSLSISSVSSMQRGTLAPFHPSTPLFRTSTSSSCSSTLSSPPISFCLSLLSPFPLCLSLRQNTFKSRLDPRPAMSKEPHPSPVYFNRNQLGRSACARLLTWANAPTLWQKVTSRSAPPGSVPGGAGRGGGRGGAGPVAGLRPCRLFLLDSLGLIRQITDTSRNVQASLCRSVGIHLAAELDH